MEIGPAKVRELIEAMISANPVTVQEREIVIGARRLAWVSKGDPQPIANQNVEALASAGCELLVIDPDGKVKLDEASANANHDIMFVPERIFNEAIQAYKAAGRPFPGITEPIAIYIESGMDNIGEFVGAVGELYRTSTGSQPLVGFQIIAGQHGDERADGSREIPPDREFAHLRALQDFSKKDAGFMRVRCPGNQELEEWLNRALDKHRLEVLSAACVLERYVEPFDSSFDVAKNTVGALGIGGIAAAGVKYVPEALGHNTIVDGIGDSTAFTLADTVDNWLVVKKSAREEYESQRAVLLATKVAESATRPGVMVESENFRKELGKLVAGEMIRLGQSGAVPDEFHAKLDETIKELLLESSGAHWNRDDAAVQKARDKMAVSKEFLSRLADLQVEQITIMAGDNGVNIDKDALVEECYEKTAAKLSVMIASSAKLRNEVEESKEFQKAEGDLKVEIYNKYRRSAVNGAFAGQALNSPGSLAYASHNILLHALGAALLALSTGLSAADAAYGNTKDNVAGMRELAESNMIVLPEKIREMQKEMHSVPVDERIALGKHIKNEIDEICSKWGNMETQASRQAQINNWAMIWSSVVAAFIPPSEVQTVLEGGSENYAAAMRTLLLKWAGNAKGNDLKILAEIKEHIDPRSPESVKKSVQDGKGFDIEEFAKAGHKAHVASRAIGIVPHAFSDVQGAMAGFLESVLHEGEKDKAARAAMEEMLNKGRADRIRAHTAAPNFPIPEDLGAQAREAVSGWGASNLPPLVAIGHIATAPGVPVVSNRSRGKT